MNIHILINRTCRTRPSYPSSSWCSFWMGPRYYAHCRVFTCNKAHFATIFSSTFWEATYKSQVFRVGVINFHNQSDSEANFVIWSQQLLAKVFMICPNLSRLTLSSWGPPLANSSVASYFWQIHHASVNVLTQNGMLLSISCVH